MDRKFKKILIVFFLFSIMVTGCDPFGSSSSNDTTSTGGSGGSGNAVIIKIDPNAAILFPGGTQQFKAVVTGSGDMRVTWKLETANSGTLSDNGFYTAPQLPGIYFVIATSLADPSKSAKAPVNVVLPGTYDSSTYDSTKYDSTIPNDSTIAGDSTLTGNYHGTITLNLQGSHTAAGTTHTYNDSGELTGFNLQGVSGGWWMSVGSNISTKASVNNSHVGSEVSTTVQYPMTTFTQAKTVIALQIDTTLNTYKIAVTGIEVNATYTITDKNGTTVNNGTWVIASPDVEVPLPSDLSRLKGSITQAVDANMPGMTWDLQRY